MGYHRAVYTLYGVSFVKGIGASQINTAIVSFGFNLESVHSLAVQRLLPMHHQGRLLYAEVQQVKNHQTKPDINKAPFALRYPAVVSTYPEMFLIESNLLKDMPFIVEKDPDVLKDSAWIIEQSRELQDGVRNYNEIIMLGWHRTMQMRGLSTFEFDGILQRQINLNDTLCLVCYQLLDLLIKIIKNLEGINQKYKIPAKRSRVKFATDLEHTMEALRKITQQPESDIGKNQRAP